jgi:mRNA interferase RelE/StbE
LGWKVEIDSAAHRQLRKIDRTWQRRIVDYLEEIAELPDPRVKGKPLRSNLSGLWRYRVGDYRLVCQLQDSVMIVRVIKIGHRRTVYDV